MSDLISKSALKESLIHCKELGRKSFEAVLKVIDDQPTIEAVPVVHGRWVPDERGVYYCSACNSEAYWTEYGQQLFKYCQECGADMRKGGVE